TAAGTRMSRGINGSTFGCFPWLGLAIAAIVRDLKHFLPGTMRRALVTGAVLARFLTVSGAAYTLTNARLLFVDANAPGPVVRSEFPSLAGLSAPGPYIGDLDAILTSTRDNVPAEDATVCLPGEDPAFFALGGRPRMPCV